MKPFNIYLQEKFDVEYLEEGLISSWDSNKLAKFIEQTFKDKIESIHYTILPNELKTTKYGEIFTVFVYLLSPLTPEEDIKLNQILSQFGYTNSLGIVSKTQLQLEPKYPVVINTLIEESADKRLFHITQEKNIDKIKRIGLTPTISKTTFDHPSNRIYFLWLPMKSDDEIQHILNKFSSMLANDKKVDPTDMKIVKSSYNPNHKYYLDDTTLILDKGIFGVFTTSNISNKDIKIFN